MDDDGVPLVLAIAPPYRMSENFHEDFVREETGRIGYAGAQVRQGIELSLFIPKIVKYILRARNFLVKDAPVLGCSA